MKRFLKITLVVGAVVLLVGLGGLGWLISKLPSRTEIAGAVKGASSTIAPVRAPTPESQSSAADPSKGGADTAASAGTGNGEKKDMGLAAIHALMSEDPRDIRVCANLGRSRIDVRKKDASLPLDQALGPERDDSVTEAFRWPLRAMFQDPAVTDLFHEIESLDSSVRDQSKEERESFFQKVGFYSHVAGAAASLYSRREQFEAMGNRAQHLGVIARLALLKPELKDSARLTDFCRQVENVDAPLDHDSVVRERKAVLALLSENGVKPADIGFDPEDWIKFSVESDKAGFRFSLKGRAEQSVTSAASPTPSSSASPQP